MAPSTEWRRVRAGRGPGPALPPAPRAPPSCPSASRMTIINLINRAYRRSRRSGRCPLSSFFFLNYAPDKTVLAPGDPPQRGVPELLGRGIDPIRGHPSPTVGSSQPGHEQPSRGSAPLLALPGKRSSGRACAAHVADRDGEVSAPGMPALTFVEAPHQREMVGRSRGCWM